MKQNILKYVCCPNCKNDLTVVSDILLCSFCKEKYVYKGGILLLKTKKNKDIDLSIKKWDKIYKDQLQNKSFNKLFYEYKTKHFKIINNQISKTFDLNHKILLEIGCGQFFLGQLLSKKCSFIIGVDFSPSALKIAKKMLDKNHIKNYLLIQGDINYLPLKSNSIDFIYGGGVIEHFRNTNNCIKELFRVLKKNGVSFNTVPYLNLFSLTVRQMWGNIPDIKYLRGFFEFLHMNILGGKHMIYGYEKSFSQKNIIKMHKSAGFRFVDVDCFFVDYWKLKKINKYIYKITMIIVNRYRLFWSFIKVIAIK